MVCIILCGSSCILTVFKFSISFFCHSITSVWALIFSFFFSLWSWFADLPGWSALLILLFNTLVDTVVFAAFLDLVPNMAIHSTWNFVTVMPSVPLSINYGPWLQNIGPTACGQTVFQCLVDLGSPLREDTDDLSC